MSNNNSDNSDVEEEKPVSSEFKDLVVTWVEIDDNIRKLNAQLKEFKDEKKQYEQAVLEYLEKIGENVIEISDGKLRRNVSKTKGALKHEIIQSALTDCTNDPEKAFQMTNYIMNKRPIVERVNLKRTKNRGPKGGN
tara:strand:+ start:384 stop:794 length:411 start_codon:yes stop_codon:yes gene_type:complete